MREVCHEQHSYTQWKQQATQHAVLECADKKAAKCLSLSMCSARVAEVTCVQEALHLEAVCVGLIR